MQLFYCPNAVISALFLLDEQESHHARTVLRKSTGDTIHVFDGKGNLYLAEIVQADKKGVAVKILSAEQPKHDLKCNIHLATALPKNTERLEWMLEKVTEVGVKEITPLICRYSERKDFRRERCEKILLNACKQSEHLTIPQLNEAIPITDWLLRQNTTYKFIAWCGQSAQHLKNVAHRAADVSIAIGPEGDFSKEEVDEAVKCGFVAVSLGHSRLRLETAALYATVVLNAWKE